MSEVPLYGGRLVARRRLSPDDSQMVVAAAPGYRLAREEAKERGERERARDRERARQRANAREREREAERERERISLPRH